MKRIIIIFLVLIAISIITIDKMYAITGSGTSTNPYLVATPTDLLWISQSSTRWGTASNYVFYRQTDDINASSLGNWTPIGTASNPFYGVYDGDGYIISNLTCNRNDYKTVFAGLFGDVLGASTSNRSVIKNLGLTNVTIWSRARNTEWATESFYALAGGIAARINRADILNCYTTGTIKASNDKHGSNDASGSRVGGIVGEAGVSLAGSMSDSRITNCYSLANLDGSTGYDNQSGNATSYGTRRNYVGGIVGNAYALTIEDCYSRGTIRSRHDGTSGTRESNSGGIAGRFVDYSYMRRCYATGSITAEGNGTVRAGGLIGCTVTSYVTVQNNRWDRQTTGRSNAIGDGSPATNTDNSPLYTSEMIVPSYFPGIWWNNPGNPSTWWNNPSVWNISSTQNNGYPHLRVFVPFDPQTVITSFPFSEYFTNLNFESTWRARQTGWSYGSGYIYTSQNISVFTPRLQLPTTSSSRAMILTYTVRSTPGYNVDYKVSISSTGKNSASFTTVDPKIATGSPAQTYQVNLADYEGQYVYINFERTSSNNSGLFYLEDARVEPLIPAPTNLVADFRSTENIVYLSWQPPKGGTPTGYRIYRNNVILANIGAITSHQDTGTVAGNTYSYYVVALYSTEVSPASNTDSTQAHSGRPSNYYLSNGTTINPNAGTVSDPYQIETLANLRWMSEQYIDWYGGGTTNQKHFKLMNDIDATETIQWNNGHGFRPIGIITQPTGYLWFYGNFDGNNKTISNLYSSANPGYEGGGLFSRITGNSTIKDLTLENITISGYEHSGGIAGVITNSSTGSIQNCTVSGNITGTASAGGLIGIVYSGTTSIENCKSTTDITSVLTGGIIGHFYNSTGANILKCYSKGEIAGSVVSGGLVGYIYSSSLTIENCYSQASISSGDSGYAGGLAGFIPSGSSSQISKNYFAGRLNALGTLPEARVGGLVGYMYSGSTVENSLWDTQTSSVPASRPVGTNYGTLTNNSGLSSGQMRTITNYSNRGWDMSTIWDINMHFNNGYPTLRTVPTPQIITSQVTASSDARAPQLVRVTLKEGSALIEWEKPLSAEPDGYILYKWEDDHFEPKTASSYPLPELNSRARSHTISVVYGNNYTYALAAFYNYTTQTENKTSKVESHSTTDNRGVSGSVTLKQEFSAEFYYEGLGAKVSAKTSLELEGSAYGSHEIEDAIVNSTDNSRSIITEQGPFVSSLVVFTIASSITPIYPSPQILSILPETETSWGNVSLSWTAPANSGNTVRGYRIYRDGELLPTEGESNSILELRRYSDNWANGGLISGNRYAYYVTATYLVGNDVKESEPSNIIYATPIGGDRPPSLTGGYGNAGSLENPYLISTLSHLRWLSEWAGSKDFTTGWWQNDNSTIHFRQEADIYADETVMWEHGRGFRPIGFNESPSNNRFRGVYDGQGYKIYNLFINSETYGFYPIGLFSSVNNTIIRNVHLVDCNIRGHVIVGGIVGEMTRNSIVEDCSVSGEIYGYASVGGIVGQALDGSTIQRCYFLGELTGNAGAGIAGTLNSSIIQDCYNAGTIIAGYNGGIAGLTMNSSIKNCYNIGDTSDFEEGFGGSIGGYSLKILENVISNNFFDIETNNVLEGFGYISSETTNTQGKTSSQMKDATTFTSAGWNMNTVWDIHPQRNHGYPYLRLNHIQHTFPAPVNEYQSLTATMDNGSVILTWPIPDSQSCGLLTGYKVFRGNVQIAIVADTTYVDSNPVNGVENTYFVRAIYTNHEGESANSNTVSIMPANPPVLQEPIVDNCSVVLLWGSQPSGVINELKFALNKVHPHNDRLVSSKRMSQPKEESLDGNYSTRQMINNKVNGRLSATPFERQMEKSDIYNPNDHLIDIDVSQSVDERISVIQSVLGDSYSQVEDSPSTRSLSSYKVYRNGVLIAQNVTTTYYLDTCPHSPSILAHPSCENNYTYHVVAVYTNPNGESAPSNVVEAIMPEQHRYNAPGTLTHSVVNGTQIRLDWSAPVPGSCGTIYSYCVLRNGEAIGFPTSTTYTDNGPINGVENNYTVKVIYTNHSGESAESNTVTYTPFQVSTLSLQSVSHCSVTLSWIAPPSGVFAFTGNSREVGILSTERVDDQKLQSYFRESKNNRDSKSAFENSPNDTHTRAVSGYHIYRNGIQIAQNVTGTTYIDTSINTSETHPSCGNTYSYYIVTVYSEPDGTSIASNTIQAILPASHIFNAPRNLAINNGILGWNEPESGNCGLLSEYRVYRNNSEIGTVLVSVERSFTDPSPVNGLNTYTVRAIYVDHVGQSDPSNTVSVTIYYPPQNLTAMIGFNSVTLNWVQPVSTTLSGYRILRNGSVLVANHTAGSNSYVDGTAINGQGYTYSVIALYTPSGESSPATVTAQMKVFNVPESLFATTVNSQVTLVWEAPEDHEFLATLAGYKVYRNGVLLPNGTDSNTLTFVDSDVVYGTAYTYYVVATYTNPVGDSEASNTASATPLSDIDEMTIPTVTSLNGNYPNPFNPETTIRFSLAREDRVSIDIYSINGQLVRSLVNGGYSVGNHQTVWNGRDNLGRTVGSGVYFYRMTTSEYTATRKMLLLK